MATDTELVTRAVAGDRDAFAALVACHQRLVVGVALAITRDAALADDIAQDTFVAAWRQLGALADRTRPGPWLAGIARNLANNAIRKQGRRRALQPEASDEAAASPHDAVASAQVAGELRRVLDELPQPQREALVLYYFEGQSVTEVAAGLGITGDVVKQRLHRARATTRDRLTSRLVSALEAARPSAAFAGGVMAVIAIGGVTKAAAATTSVATHTTEGKLMLFTKLAIAAAAVLTAGGATAYAVHASHDDAPTTHAPVRLSKTAQTRAALGAQIQAAHRRRFAALSVPTPPTLEETTAYLTTVIGSLSSVVGDCFTGSNATGKVEVQANIDTDPDVGAVITDTTIVADETTVTDPAVLECVRQTLGAVELDPAEFSDESLTLQTIVDARTP
jgi:RNA polymerase sigma factor (sigma-70 family)